MEITKEQVSMIMASLSIRFPESGYTLPQLQLLSEEYYEDLRVRMNAAELEEAYKTVRAECRFFPKVADFIEARPELYTNNMIVGSMYQSFSENTKEYDENHPRISNEEWAAASHRRAKRMEREAEERKTKFGNIKKAVGKAFNNIDSEKGTE